MRTRRSCRKKNKQRRNERDAYVSFLIVTSSTLRYRPGKGEREREKERKRESGQDRAIITPLYLA